jgi:hypothetical protein
VNCEYEVGSTGGQLKAGAASLPGALFLAAHAVDINFVTYTQRCLIGSVHPLGKLLAFSNVCCTLQRHMRLVTITEAAQLEEVARTTIQRWIKSGRLEKSGGKVSLADVARCKAEHYTGRPLGCWRTSLAEEHAARFLPAEGGRRLRAMLEHCAFEFGYRGKSQQYKDALAGSWNSLLAGERYREREQKLTLRRDRAPAGSFG